MMRFKIFVVPLLYKNLNIRKEKLYPLVTIETDIFTVERSNTIKLAFPSSQYRIVQFLDKGQSRITH